MMSQPRICQLVVFLVLTVTVMTMAMVSENTAHSEELTDKQIAEVIAQKHNKGIIEAFLRQELQEVNRYATRPLLKKYPSLEFFVKQANREPFQSLLFLEEQVYKLRDVQQNIDSVVYKLAFSEREKQIILGLEPTAKKIISYGIPLMKRNFYRVVRAVTRLSRKGGNASLDELIARPGFRDAVYRAAEPDPRKLDQVMGEMSQGELICIRLGWELEKVTVTRLWLAFNDSSLPKPEAYYAYRKKRSEYWEKRLRRIYGNAQ
jgi:hypothetical protein